MRPVKAVADQQQQQQAGEQREEDDEAEGGQQGRRAQLHSEVDGLPAARKPAVLDRVLQRVQDLDPHQVHKQHG